MNRVAVRILFENKNLDVDERVLNNFIEFAVRSMFGIVAGSLLEYQVYSFDLNELTAFIEVADRDTFKIVSALALVGSYGISRVKTSSRILPN
jgi:RNase P/RNase MRP subunit POP5